MSGKTRILFSFRISSAPGVVGPLAPSAIILALTLGALYLVITPSIAQGANISTSNSKSSLLDMSLVECGYPRTVWSVFSRFSKTYL